MTHSIDKSKCIWLASFHVHIMCCAFQQPTKPEAQNPTWKLHFMPVTSNPCLIAIKDKMGQIPVYDIIRLQTLSAAGHQMYDFQLYLSRQYIISPLIKVYLSQPQVGLSIHFWSHVTLSLTPITVLLLSG